MRRATIRDHSKYYYKQRDSRPHEGTVGVPSREDSSGLSMRGRQAYPMGTASDRYVASVLRPCARTAGSLNNFQCSRLAMYCRLITFVAGVRAHATITKPAEYVSLAEVVFGTILDVKHLIIL